MNDHNAPPPTASSRSEAAMYWEGFGLTLDEDDRASAPVPREGPDGDALDAAEESTAPAVTDIPREQPESSDTASAGDAISNEAPLSTIEKENAGVTAGSDELSEAGAPRRGFAYGVLGAVGAILALLGVAGWLLPGALSAHDQDEQRHQVTAATRQMMTNLVSLKHQTAQGDVDRLLDGATGAFREQFGGAAATFRTVIEQGQVVSTGQVTEVGVQDIGDGTATTLAAVRARVANSDAPNGEERSYRMRVNLQNENGRWLVSDVQFVP